MKTSPGEDEVIVLFGVYCLPLRAVVPSHDIIHIEIIPTLHRSSLWVPGGMNAKRKLVVLWKYPEVIDIYYIHKVLLCRVYFNGDRSGAKKLVLYLLLHGPRNIAATNPFYGKMLNSADWCADLAAADRVSVAGLPVAIHLGRPDSLVEAELLVELFHW